MYLTIPEILKRHRERLKMTQADVAKHLNVSVRTYQNYENGSNELTTNIILKLCDLYKISSDELLTGEKKTESKKISDFKLKGDGNVVGEGNIITTLERDIELREHLIEAYKTIEDRNKKIDQLREELEKYKGRNK
jgi:transcriptional regulator with XRE-family HTH domain